MIYFDYENANCGFSSLSQSKCYVAIVSELPYRHIINPASINALVSFTKLIKNLRKVIPTFIITMLTTNDLVLFSTFFVKGCQTLSRVIGFIWNMGEEARFQYNITNKDYESLKDMTDRFRSGQENDNVKPIDCVLTFGPISAAFHQLK